MVTQRRPNTIRPPEPLELWLDGAPAAPSDALTALIVGAYDPPEEPRAEGKDAFEAVYCGIIAQLSRSHEKLSAAYRTEGYDPKEDQLSRAARRAISYQQLEKEPTYRLEEVWPFFQAKDGFPPLRDPQRMTRLEDLDQPAVWYGVLGNEFAPISPFLGHLVFRSVSGIQPDLTLAWAFKRRVFAIGKYKHLVQTALGHHHKVETPQDLIQLRAELRDLNPWRASLLRYQGDPPAAVHWHSPHADRPLEDLPESPAWRAIRLRLAREYGIDPIGAVESWRDLEDPDSAYSATPYRVESFRHIGSDVHTRVRQVLTELGTRDFEGAYAGASAVFRLERASSAPMLVLSKLDRDDFHVLADLGSGHLLRIRARRFREPAAPLRVARMSPIMVLDGGDIRLWMYSHFDEALAGADLAARPRR